MGKKDKTGPFIIEDLEILAAGSEGNAIGRYNEMVVFVPFVVPGDIADVRVISRKRRFLEGRVLRMKHFSSARVKPVCSHFGICGGCKWQAMPYPDQLKFKQQQVLDNFSRIGHLSFPDIRPILPAPATEYYRNKLEYTFSPNRWLTQEEIGSDQELIDRNALGFHIPGMFDRILDIDTCHLQAEPGNQIRKSLRQFALSHQLRFYNIRTFEGDLRNLIIRNSTSGDLMAIVVFGTDNQEIIDLVMQFLADTFTQITSLFYIVNQKHNDSISDLNPVLFAGKPFITETMENLSFRIGPLSFYQTNALQAYNLYKVVRDFADLTGHDVVYDLYTGTGTIANFIAHQAKKVVGIEYVEAAVKDADSNSRLNNIDNAFFFSGDMARVLNPEFIAQNGVPDVVITDPPRAGMHEKVIDQLLLVEPSKIVYVSCNPATQARDLALLATKYTIEAVQPVDMFPHTHHVENVCMLKLKL